LRDRRGKQVTPKPDTGPSFATAPGETELMDAICDRLANDYDYAEALARARTEAHRSAFAECNRQLVEARAALREREGEREALLELEQFARLLDKTRSIGAPGFYEALAKLDALRAQHAKTPGPLVCSVCSEPSTHGGANGLPLWCSKHGPTPAAATREEWSPHIGEKVRVVDTGDIVEVFAVYMGGPKRYDCDDADGDRSNYMLSDIEPLPAQPAPVEAAKLPEPSRFEDAFCSAEHRWVQGKTHDSLGSLCTAVAELAKELERLRDAAKGGK